MSLRRSERLRGADDDDDDDRASTSTLATDTAREEKLVGRTSSAFKQLKRVKLGAVFVVSVAIVAAAFFVIYRYVNHRIVGLEGFEPESGGENGDVATIVNYVLPAVNVTLGLLAMRAFYGPTIYALVTNSNMTWAQLFGRIARMLMWVAVLLGGWTCALALMYLTRRREQFWMYERMEDAFTKYHNADTALGRRSAQAAWAALCVLVGVVVIVLINLLLYRKLIYRAIELSRTVRLLWRIAVFLFGNTVLASVLLGLTSLGVPIPDALLQLIAHNPPAPNGDGNDGTPPPSSS